jgi:uncharacterized protein YuzE
MKKVIKYSYDPKADAVYITFSESPVSYTKNLDDIRVIDYDSKNNPVGIELLCVNQGVTTDELPYRDEINKILAKKDIKILV